MEDKETINVLIAQLLSKDDEILRLRNLLDDLQREQQSGNMQILSKLDRALEELKSMRHDNKALSNRLSRALEAKSAAEEKIQELSSALEALENTRADELYEIARQKRQLYGRKSEKKSSLSATKQKTSKRIRMILTAPLLRLRLKTWSRKLRNQPLLRPLPGLNPLPAVRIMASSPPVRRMWWYITVMNRISLRVHAR